MSSRPRLIGLLLALVTLVIYLPVRQHDFVVYDDYDYILENSHVQDGVTMAGVEWALTSRHASNWHPLTWLSHMLDCQLFGLNPGAHHLVNALIHAANAVLLFLLLLRLSGALWPAAIVAALFAWHPLHVEPVAWASERKEVLCAFFGLLTLLVYARYAEEKQKYNPHSGMFYGGALGLFTLGLLAKPMLVTLPFVLLLLDWWPLRRIFSATTWNITFGRATLEKLPFFALSAASCVITLVAQQPVAVRSLDQYPLPLRLENSLLSYARYLWKTVWPADLAIIYPLPQSIPMASMALTVVVLAALTWLAWRSRRACPALLMGWLWFLGMLVPVIGLMQVGGQAMADRYTYLPHIGLFFAVMYGIQTLAKRWRIKTVALAAGAGLILIGCLAGTAHQLPFWQNSETLFRHALAVTHKNPIAHINLGVALQQQGERQAALEQFRAALRLDPTYVQAHNNLAILLDEMDQNDEAISEYQESLRLSPNAPLVHCNFGTLLAKLGRFDEAMAQYVEAARLAPEDPRPHYLMGRAALRQGQSSTAVAHFQDALLRSRNDFKTLTQLARVLASDPDPQVRNGQQAVALAEQASLLTGGSNPFVLDTLAMAYAEAGRLAEAEQAVQKALDLAAASGEELPEAVKQRRHLYSSGQPFRESFTNAPSEESAITRP